jgi:diaminopimelate epimerase
MHLFAFCASSDKIEMFETILHPNGPVWRTGKEDIMTFVKMHGAGNDFIIVDNRNQEISVEKMPEIAQELCPRRTSVGADGIMFLNPPVLPGPEADVDMYFFNASGLEGEMCGNGARCVCRYMYEYGISDETQRIRTKSGLVTGQRIDDTRYRIRLNDITVRKNNVYTEFEGHRYLCDYMEMGEPGLPHVVVELPGLTSMDREELRPLGVYLRNFFPHGANVNFFELAEDGHVELLTYERGVEDFTLACGTGAGCTASHLVALGRAKPEGTSIHVPGGWLEVAVEGGRYSPSHDIYLTGPTCVVYEGETILA